MTVKDKLNIVDNRLRTNFTVVGVVSLPLLA